MLNLLILTSYFALEPKKVKGGIGYRYVGLYGSLVRILLSYSPDSKVFWYSQTDCSLKIIGSNSIQRKNSSMFSALLYAVASTYKERSHLAIIVAYPYAYPGIKKVAEFFFCLLFPKLFFTSRAKVIVDDFDPPVEAMYAFGETSPPLLKKIYQRVLEMLALKSASVVLALSEFWKQYLTRMYNLDKNKVFIVSNGSLTGQIPYIPPKSERPLTVLYAGSAMKAKDVDKLVQAIVNLTEKGLKINLCVAGIRLTKLPQWVQVLQYNWPDFVERVLTRSDICVIPYPPNKFLFNNSVPAKLFDYMAAGKPIVSTNLNGVRSIIENFDCGLIAKDWNEFEFFLAKLYHNIPYAVELGKNGRTTAEKHFDYELIAKSLLIHIINIFN